ncbi:hypothetical protein [Polaribacter sp.]|uniref:hypothetical protein n=1 Tax=Polaribacter sp. TaxID=1920175 RepID=UPI003F6B6B54
MKKAILIFSLSIFCFLVSCSKEEPKNLPPTAVSLTFPTQNQLCINNSITFNWSDATDPEEEEIQYRIIIAKDRQLTNIVETRSLSASQLTLTLDKATAYYWQVIASDESNNESAPTVVNAFYTKGDASTNYAPFMADLKTPENNANINSGSVSLTWEASDVNTSDDLTYEVFFGENTTLTLLESAVTTKTYDVTVESGKTYSWQINVIDDKGAKSIGQIWSFTVN